MYNQDKMKKLIYEAHTIDAMHDEANDEFFFDKLKEIIELLQSREDVDEFARYMDNMTQKEYDILGSFIDEIEEQYVTRNFVEALRKLIIKYPLDIPKNRRESQIENVMLRVFEEELADREKEKK